MDLKYLCEKYKLNDTEKSILNYLYRNISNLKKIGIRKVAKDNYTSTTTVYKLCKKLNFEGYSDMISGTVSLQTGSMLNRNRLDSTVDKLDPKGPSIPANKQYIQISSSDGSAYYTLYFKYIYNL